MLFSSLLEWLLQATIYVGATCHPKISTLIKLLTVSHNVDKYFMAAYSLHIVNIYRAECLANFLMEIRDF